MFSTADQLFINSDDLILLKIRCEKCSFYYLKKTAFATFNDGRHD